MFSKKLKASTSSLSRSWSFHIEPRAYHALTCGPPEIPTGAEHSISIPKTWASKITTEEWGSVYVDSPADAGSENTDMLIVNVGLKEYDPISGDHVEMLRDSWDSSYILFLYRKAPNGDDQIHGLVLLYTIPPVSLEKIEFEQVLDAIQFEIPVEKLPVIRPTMEMDSVPIFERRIRSPNTDVKGQPRIYKDKSTGTIFQTRLGAYSLLSPEEVNEESTTDLSVYSYGIAGYTRSLDKVEIIQFGNTSTMVLVKRGNQIGGIVLINALISNQSLITLSSAQVGDLLEEIFLKVYISKGNSSINNTNIPSEGLEASSSKLNAGKIAKVKRPKIHGITLGRPISLNKDPTLALMAKQEWVNQILTEQMGAVHLKFNTIKDIEPEDDFIEIGVLLEGYRPNIGDCVNSSMDAESGAYVLILRRRRFIPLPLADRIRGLAILHAVSRTCWENTVTDTLKLDQLLFKTTWNKVLPYSLREDPNCSIPDWYIKYRLGQNIRLDCKGNARLYETEGTSFDTRLGVYLHEIKYTRKSKANLTAVSFGISHYSKFLDVTEVLRFGVGYWKHEGTVVLVKRDNIVRGLIFINALDLSHSNRRRHKWKIQKLCDCNARGSEGGEETSEVFLKIYIHEGQCRPWVLGYIHWIGLAVFCLILILVCVIVFVVQ